MLKVYIGWDSREKVAYDVCRHSIEHHTFCDVSIVPLVHRELRRQGWFNRPWIVDGQTGNWVDMIDGKPFSTEFSHSRFLVPALTRYEGWALFMDCDMVFDVDIKELFALADPKYAVMCVRHYHNPTNSMKMDGQPQSRYYRKNWSSFVLWNCSHPLNKQLTAEVVNKSAGSYLHGFSWLEDKDIGALPPEYNWIEGVSRSDVKPKVIHYTEGGPWFEDHREVMYADKWWRNYNRWIDSQEYEPIKETVNVSY